MLDDSQVRLVGDKEVNVFGSDATLCEETLHGVDDRLRRELEDLTTVHPQVGVDVEAIAASEWAATPPAWDDQ